MLRPILTPHMSHASYESQLASAAQLTPGQAAPYVQVFGEDYWRDGDNLPPILRSNMTFQASRIGKSMLRSLVVGSQGRQRLGDPERKIEGFDVLYSLEFPRKTILKVQSESLLWVPEPQRASETERYASTHTDSGFSILRAGGGAFVRYDRDAKWWTVAEAKGIRQSFFQLQIDTGTSYSAGLESDYNAVVQVTGADDAQGLHSFRLNHTEASPVGEAQFYVRNRSVAVYGLVSSL